MSKFDKMFPDNFSSSWFGVGASNYWNNKWLLSVSNKITPIPNYLYQDKVVSNVSDLLKHKANS